MYCAPCRSERLGRPKTCAVCGAELSQRTPAELEVELSHVVWVLTEVPRWDADAVPASGKAVLAAKYRQQERVLRSALAERVDPAQRVVVAEAPPPPPVAPPRVRRTIARPPPPPPAPAPLLHVEPRKATLDDRVVEEASVWHRIWKPFLHESVGWFIGGFLILAGTLYGVYDAWGAMSGTAHALTVFGVAAAWTAGLAAWARFLSRREATKPAGRVLALIAGAVAPLAPLALSPIVGAAPLLVGPALLAWAGFVFVLARGLSQDRWLPVLAALTAAVMALAPLAASPWLALVPLAVLVAGARKSTPGPFALLAPLYLLALFCIRVHAAAAPNPATWAPILAGALYGASLLHRPRAADPLSVGAVLAQAMLLGISALGDAPAPFVTAVALCATAVRLRLPYPAYLGGATAFVTCGQLVPEQLDALLDRVRTALHYAPSKPLPWAYTAVYLAVYVAAAGVFAAVKLKGPVRQSVLTATAWASGAVGLIGLQSVAHDVRPALWSAPLVAVLCLALGPLFARRSLSGVGAALAAVTGVALLASGAGGVAAGGLALGLAVLSIFQLRGHRQAYSAGAGLLTLLALGDAFVHAGAAAGIGAVVLASAAALLVARNLASEELLALAWFVPACVLPKVALVVAPGLVGPALASSSLLLAAISRPLTASAQRPPHPLPLPYEGRGSASYAAWMSAIAAPLLPTPLLGATLLVAALALFASRAHAVAMIFTAAAMLPLGAHAPLPFMTRELAGGLALAVSLGASVWSYRRGRSWRPALAAVLAVAVALSCGLTQTSLAVAAVTALLSTFALLPAVSVPAAALLAACATFFHPAGLLAVAVGTSALALLEPKVKGIAWPASLSALALAPSTIGMTAWAAPAQLMLHCAVLAASVLLWVRATRWPFFAALIAPFALVPQLASAPPWHLWAAVLAVVALTRVLQLAAPAQRLVHGTHRAGWMQNALCAGLVAAGAALWLTGNTALLPFVVGLVLASGEPAAWRVAAATAFALVVPGVLPLAAVGLIGLAFAARHSPRAARWVLGDEQRGWTVAAAAVASVVCAAFAVFQQPGDAGAVTLLGGCLAACSVLLGFRWMLPLAVGSQFAVGSEQSAVFGEGLLIVVAALAAVSRIPHVSSATLRRCARIGRAFDGPLATPLWLGAALSLALVTALRPAPLALSLPAAALLLVTGVAWEAAAAVVLAAAALAFGVPAPFGSSVLAATGLLLCASGALLERRHAVGRVWHHAGWLLALAALPLSPGLESPLTVSTAVAGAACIWVVAVRKSRHEWLAWLASAVALHLGLFFAGLRLGHGAPHALILPWCGLALAALGALALQLKTTASREVAGLVAVTFGLAEVASSGLLLDAAYPREALVALAAVVLALLALGRRVLADDDAVAAWLAQAAAVLGFVAVRWLGFHAAPGATAAFASLVFGALLGGVARVLPFDSAKAARTGAWLWPLAGLFAAPFSQVWVVAGLLLAHALHFAVLARTSRRFAALSSLAFNAALAFGWMAAGLNHPQYLLVPVGLTALVLLKVFEERLSAPALQRCRAAAVTLIYAASAFEPLAMPTPWALWLCALVCVLGVAAGIAFKVRSYVFLGTGFLVTTVVSSLARYGIQQPRVGALLLSGLGLLVVAFMVLVTTRRSELLARYQRARSMLAQWEG